MFELESSGCGLNERPTGLRVAVREIVLGWSIAATRGRGTGEARLGHALTRRLRETLTCVPRSSGGQDDPTPATCDRRALR